MSETKKNITIAVLYAKADKAYWDEMQKHVGLLAKRYDNVDIWSVQDVALGSKVSQEIRNKLSTADITLLLLSADFAYNEVFDEETRILLGNFASQPQPGRFIMPVLVKDFMWRNLYDEDYDLEKMKIFDKIIHEPDKREATYREITENLNTYIEEINSRSIQVVIPTWAGFMGAIMYNDGFIKNKNTSLYKEFNRQLRYELNDSVEDTCQAMIAGEADMIWATLDRLPSVLHKLKDRDPKVIFQASWSNGADAIIARNGIEKIEDLKGKKVVYPFDSPALTLLKYVLLEHDLDIFDVFHQPQKHVDLDVLTTTFIHDETIDAIVIWSPYVEACLSEIPDAKVLVTTSKYPSLIADVLVAPSEFIKLNQEELVTMFKGWFTEVALFSEDKIYKAGSLGVLVEAIMKPLPSIIPGKLRGEIAESLRTYFDSSLEKVHLCTLENNKEFFGIGDHSGDEAKVLYDAFLKMQFSEFISEPSMQWENVLDTTILEKIKLGND